jgi:cyanuric acid amidohydrolase
MGNSRSSKSPFRVGHAAMSDGIDVRGVYAALASAGIKANGPLAMEADNPVDHVFLKSAVDGIGACRGRRHVLASDFLGPYAWLIGKAVIHATVAGIVGDPMMQVSGGSEHQGRPGGGHLAVIARA